MGKNILMINSSPRKNGKTATMISHFITNLETINENFDQNAKFNIERIDIYDYTISHCIGCDKCLKKPHQCPLSEKDDMLKIEEKMKSADAIIIGAPSYFGSPPAGIKDLIDRSRPMKMDKYQLKDKIFSVLSAAGLRGGGINSVQDVLIHFALIQGMIVVGALGHPVLVGNLPSSTLQKEELTSFSKKEELNGVTEASIKALSERITKLLR